MRLDGSLARTSNAEDSHFHTDDGEKQSIDAAISGLEKSLLYINVEVFVFVGITVYFGVVCKPGAGSTICIEPSLRALGRALIDVVRDLRISASALYEVP